MTTEYAISDDGVNWRWRGTALAGRVERMTDSQLNSN
jgi:hypothetical protein